MIPLVINCTVLHFLVVCLVFLVFFLLRVIFKASTPPPSPKIYTQDYRSGDLEWKKLCPPKTGDKYAVIGVGQLGSQLVTRLLEREENEVVAIDIRSLEHLQDDKRLIKMKGSVLDVDFLKTALKGIDTVFLTASHNGFFQNHIFQYQSNHEVDIFGTENVLNVSMSCGVKRLIYTSSSAILIGSHPTRLNLDEYTEYSSLPISHYARTKLQAEKAVLLSHNKSNLHTVCIRPCSIMFGERDQFLTSKLKNKKTEVWFGHNVVDYTYVDNVVLAELLVEKKMRDFRGLQQVGGYTFCISNDQPMTHWDFNLRVKHFFPELKIRSLSDHYVWLRAWWMEFLLILLGGVIDLGDGDQKSITAALYWSLSYTFKIDRAREVLGYKPAYTVDEGILKAVKHWNSAQKK